MNKIINQDCVQGLSEMESGIADLCFADPPFNIGYQYDAYHDVVNGDEYVSWCGRWIGEVHRVLKPTGSFWLAIGDEYVSNLKLVSDSVGFHMRSWVIWHYAFGVNLKNNFAKCHTHILYFVKDKKNFTFNSDEIRVDSARGAVYNDRRANAKGKIPENVWILRPSEAAGMIDPTTDVWEIPRLCGTHKERVKWHPCQMPELVLERIIRTCSNPGELVVDPFSGSGTTSVVSRKLGRHSISFEMSKTYAALGQERVKEIDRKMESRLANLFQLPGKPHGD